MIRVFRHYVSAGALVLAASECMLFFSLIIAIEVMATRLGIGTVTSGHSDFVPTAMAAWIAIVVVTVMIALGMYSRHVIWNSEDAVRGLAVTFTLAFAAVCGTIWLFSAVMGDQFVSARTIAIAVPLCGLVAAATHSAFAPILHGRRFNRRVLVIGSGRMAQKISLLSKLGGTQFTVVGYVRSTEEDYFQDIHPLFSSGELSDPLAALDFMHGHDVDEIVIATREWADFPYQSLVDCRMNGVVIQNFTSFCESKVGCLDPEELDARSLIFNDGFRMSRRRSYTKQAFDYVLAILFLVATLPITVTTALAIKLTSPGPIFYLQERVGRHGKPFWLIKFRSMRVDAEADGPTWAKRNDDRVSAVGAFIRKYRIDELPQVINVLRGEMSFVGPRPERPFFVEKLRKSIPYFDLRHQVSPGITGWAQINYPYGASVEDAKRKHSYDLYYLKNGGIFLDTLIFLQTARVIIWNSGAR